MSTDPQTLRRALSSARFRFDPGAQPTPPVGPDVHASWTRCLDVVPEERTAPVELDDPVTWWSDSPIRRAAAGAIAELADLARREDYVAAVTDGSGHILWSSAGRAMRRRAEAANFVDGANWSERIAGTNAPGLSLVTGRASTVFATEHWCTSVQDWVCYAAPVRDPTGHIVGVVDLSAHWEQASPLALTTVRSVARVVELELAADPHLQRSALRIRVLGEPRASLRERPLRLSHRQFEVLTILVLHPDGLHLDELHFRLYGDRPVSSSTLKAEISHLRGALDGGIDSRPYRLTLPCDLDAAIALEALRHGDAATALRCYRGPLLPTSESPCLVELRHHLDVALRMELLVNGSDAELLDFANHHPFDVELLERALVVTPPDSPLRPEILARLTAA